MAGLSKSLVEVGISMVLKDGFSDQAGKISGSYLNMMNEMQKWNRAVMDTHGKNFDLGMQTLDRLSESYKHYADISGEMFLVGKIAKATAEQQNELLDITQQVNKQTPLTNADIVSGERYLAMAGNSAEAIQKMIGPASELATIFQTTVGNKGGTADLLTNIMATFNIASKDAAKTADILYTATTSANISLTDLAQSLQYSGSTFRNAGIDLSTAAAAIGVLGDQGIQASSAGTALANMIRYLTLSITGQKAKGATVLKALGITKDDLVDANGNLKDMGTLMSVLADRMGRLSGTAREAAMYNIFGVRGQRAASGLFQALWNGSGKMQSIIDAANNSEGSLHESLLEYMNTDIGAINQLTAAIDNLQMSIGKAQGGVFKPLIQGATKLVDLINEAVKGGGFGKFMVRFVTIGTIVFTLVSGVKTLSGIFRIVAFQVGQINAGENSAVTGMGRMTAQAASLEMHLRTIVALMAKYVGMSMTAGATFTLPDGSKLTRNKAGMIGIVMPSGKTVSSAEYANTYAAASAAGAASKTAKAASTISKAAKVGSFFKGAGGLALGMMGGWWGVGITAAMVGITYAMDKLSDSTDKNTKAVDNNTQQMSSQEIMANFLEKYAESLASAIQNSNPNVVVTVESPSGITNTSGLPSYDEDLDIN